MIIGRRRVHEHELPRAEARGGRAPAGAGPPLRIMIKQ